MLHPSAGTARVPRFYLDPAGPALLERLVRCGEQAGLHESPRSDWQYSRRQLQNPIAHDTRGGMSAEILLCRIAQTHPQRTDTITEAEVILMCPFLFYNLMLGEAPHCNDGSIAGSRMVTRTAQVTSLAKRSAAWNASLPHVFIGTVEHSAFAYKMSRFPFGHPPPPFVIQANADHWPGFFRQNAMIPYLPNVALMSLAVKAAADAKINGLDADGSRASKQKRLLLFFRGTLDFGGSRGPLLRALATLGDRNEDVVFEAFKRPARTDWALDNASQLSYVQRIQQSTFCLAPSGHTCESRRVYDALAVGCIPIIVDCNVAPYPFDQRIDFREFIGYYPLAQITRHPEAFVQCLRTLQRRRAFIQRIQQSMHNARKQLMYGWWTREPSAATSIFSSEWELAQSGGVLDQVLIEAAVPRWKRFHLPVMTYNTSDFLGTRNDARRPRAFDMRQMCSGEEKVRVGTK